MTVGASAAPAIGIHQPAIWTVPVRSGKRTSSAPGIRNGAQSTAPAENAAGRLGEAKVGELAGTRVIRSYSHAQSAR